MIPIVVFLLAGSFMANETLWAEIDIMNEELTSPETKNEELEALFEQAVKMALSPELSHEFESIREDAFNTGDFTTADSFIERAAPGITVLMLGESNAIGVNVLHFLGMAEPGTTEYEFFDLATDGFYANGSIGTADLPVWMERDGSSAQAVMLPDIARAYAGIWEGLGAGFHGYFLDVARETITLLGGDPDIETI